MAINMENGNYYAFNETASLLWTLVEAGCTRSQMLTAFGARFDAGAAELEQGIETGISIFLSDQLIEEVSDERACATLSAAEVGSGAKRPFVTPTVDRHEDMQEMLLADPIHDVDAAGWPTLK